MDDNTFESIRNQVERAIGEYHQTQEETAKQQKIARLIILLTKIEKELATVKITLAKLEGVYINRTNKQAQFTLANIQSKQRQLDDLALKVKKARLNLNYTFI